jgi:hypothetical protein
VAIKLNDVGYYFETKERLLQWDPLSPITLADILAILIERTKNKDQLAGVVHLVDGGLSIL